MIPSLLSTLPLLGIDASKATFDVCLRTADNALHRHTFPNNSKGFAKLNAWLKRLHASCTLAGVEATGPYSAPLLYHLHGKGHQVCMLNPRHVKDFARSQGRRVKTDPVDAQVIASFLRCQDRLKLWQPAPEELRVLQALVRRRQQITIDQNSEHNRLEDPLLPPSVRQDIQDHAAHLQDCLLKATQAIELHVLSCPSLQKSVRLLRSIPGVGLMVAVTILAEVPDILGFKRARELAAFVGLTPSLAQSGTSVHRRGHMTHEGSALLRKMLYMAALQAVKRTSSPFYNVYQSFVARGKAKMCALGALMHKILRIAYGVLKHETPFVPSLAKLS